MLRPHFKTRRLASLLFASLAVGCLAPKEVIGDLAETSEGDRGAVVVDVASSPDVARSDPGATDFGPPLRDPGPSANPYPEIAPLPRGVLQGARTVAPVLDREVQPLMLRLISEARQDLCLLAFGFVDGAATLPVEIGITQALERGVRVRAVVENLDPESAAFAERLRAKGATVMLQESEDAHTKLLVADGERALVGSTNLSQASLALNHEVNVVLGASDTVETARGYCEDRVADPAVRRSVKAPAIGPVILYGDGRIDEPLRAAVQAATTRVDAVVFAVNAGSDAVDALIEDLRAAVRRGVKVRVLLERSDFNSGVNQVNSEARAVLQGLGACVAFDAPTIQTHAKLLVTDDRAVVTTGNWTFSGFVQNHEMAAEIREAVTVEALRSYLDRLFLESGACPL